MSPSESTPKALTPDRVGVIGGGRMGTGIAVVFAQAGSAVTVLERDAASARAATEHIARIGTSLASTASDVDASQPCRAASVTTDPVALSTCDLIVEAVPEDLVAKQEVLRTAEASAPGAALATNTSSLPIDGIAEGLQKPSALIGLHFFNPVHRSDLVEIVIGKRTSADVRAAAHAWVRALQKTPIEVNDAPGFATSRLGIALALEAMRMVEEGVASAEDIDIAMQLGYRHRLGPLATSDLVGLDVRLNIADHLVEQLGPRFAAPDILRRMVSDGHLGRKSGRGFFSYAGSSA